VKGEAVEGVSVEAHLLEADWRLLLVCQLGEHGSAGVGAVGQEVELGTSQDERRAWAMVFDLRHPLLTTTTTPSPHQSEKQ
jgi:hypothetical protein